MCNRKGTLKCNTEGKYATGTFFFQRLWVQLVDVVVLVVCPCTCWDIPRGIHGSIKYGPIRVLFFNRELQIVDHYLRPLSEAYIYLTAILVSAS